MGQGCRFVQSTPQISCRQMWESPWSKASMKVVTNFVKVLLRCARRNAMGMNCLCTCWNTNHAKTTAPNKCPKNSTRKLQQMLKSTSQVQLQKHFTSAKQTGRAVAQIARKTGQNKTQPG